MERLPVDTHHRSGLPADIPQLWEVVLARIREEILGGDLQPGARLIETDLAARFGTSRGPVRDALRELAREGLVSDVPRRGTVVATLSGSDLVEVYGVREALEVGACRIVIQAASDGDLEGLDVHVSAIERGTAAESDYLSVSEADFAFHRGFIQLVGNARLAAIYERMLAQTALLLRTAASANPVLRTGMEKPVHSDLLRALLTRDTAAAQAAVEHHYRYAEERLFPGLTDGSLQDPQGA
jgi:DNA-binding GntR family transcriptional regulator